MSTNTGRRGAVVSLVDGLGPARTSDWQAQPSTPSGFVHGYGEDLAALAAAGVTDVRLPFDWSRLEPGEDRWDGDAQEWYDAVLAAAAMAGLRPWACLWEGPLPAWFADAGGFGDERVAGRRWPRFVDRVAETFGDRVAGWVPLDRPAQRAEAAWLTGTRPPGRRDRQRHAEVVRALLVAWRDAWRQLQGGASPVAAWLGLDRVAVDADDPGGAETARRGDQHRFEVWGRAWRDGVIEVPGLPERSVPDLVGAVDLLGLSLTFDASVRVDDPERAEADVDRWVQQGGELVRRLVEVAPERPVLLAVRLRRDDADGRHAGVVGAIRVANEAAGDGLVVEGVFVEPALDGLLTRDREDTAASRALAASPRP